MDVVDHQTVSQDDENSGVDQKTQQTQEFLIIGVVLEVRIPATPRDMT
jgi:hypothetical protein